MLPVVAFYQRKFWVKASKMFCFRGKKICFHQFFYNVVKYLFNLVGQFIIWFNLSFSYIKNVVTVRIRFPKLSRFELWWWVSELWQSCLTSEWMHLVCLPFTLLRTSAHESSRQFWLTQSEVDQLIGSIMINYFLFISKVSWNCLV